MKKYVFRPYDSIFPTLFAQEKERILKVIHTPLIIEHIGSTAVANLGGKGIIDIGIAVKKEDMDFVKKELIVLGYEYRSTFSTNERFYFITYRTDPLEGTRRYHLHLTYPENQEWVAFLAFRDYLKSHPQDLKEYELLKQKALQEAQEDGTHYRKSKEPLFAKVRSLTKNN